VQEENEPPSLNGNIKEKKSRVKSTKRWIDRVKEDRRALGVEN